MIHIEILLDSSIHVPAGTQMNMYQVYQDKEGNNNFINIL